VRADLLEGKKTMKPIQSAMDTIDEQAIPNKEQDGPDTSERATVTYRLDYTTSGVMAED